MVDPFTSRRQQFFDSDSVRCNLNFMKNGCWETVINSLRSVLLISGMPFDELLIGVAEDVSNLGNDKSACRQFYCTG
jgi:hypothetical protein